MIYVKVNDALYPASISGKMADPDWGNRETKLIKMDLDYAAVNAMFAEGVTWGIVCEDFVPVLDEEGNPILDDNGDPTYVVQQTEFDNSAFNMRGDITVHANGTCTVKMGQKTEIEELRELSDELLLEVLGV